MRERLRMFGATRSEVERLLKETEKESHNISSGMRDHGHDGDAIDDPQMWELMRQRELLEAKRRTLAALLSPDNEIVTESPATDRVNIGHQVKLEVVENDNRRTELTVTIGTSIDSTYLRREEIVVVSTESPLGNALVGAREDQVVGKIGDLKSVKVLKISKSPLLSSE